MFTHLAAELPAPREAQLLQLSASLRYRLDASGAYVLAPEHIQSGQLVAVFSDLHQSFVPILSDVVALGHVKELKVVAAPGHLGDPVVRNVVAARQDKMLETPHPSRYNSQSGVVKIRTLGEVESLDAGALHGKRA